MPLVLNPRGLNYVLPRTALLRGLILLLGAAHVVALSWGDGALHPRLWLQRPLVRPILAVGAVTLLTAFTSLVPLTSLWGSYHRQQGAYLTLLLVAWSLLVAGSLRTARQRRRVSTVVAITGTLLAITPFVESFYWHENPFTWRPGGTLGNPIFLGATLVMTLPFTLATMIASVRQPSEVSENSKASRLHLVWGTALLLQLVALLITQSRGPWLGALAGLSLFVALFLGRSHRRWIVGGLIVAVLVGGGLLAGLNIGVVPAERLSRLPYVGRAVKATDLSRGTTRVRLVLWQAALQLVTTWPEIGLEPDALYPLRPLIGYGPDTSAVAYTAVYPPELAHIEDPDAIWDRAHNELLDVVVMRGLLGLAALGWLAVALGQRGYRLWRHAASSTDRLWVAAPLAALVAHAVEVQFAFSITTTQMLGWLAVAWIAALPREADAASVTQDAQASLPAIRWRIYAAVGTLLLVAVALRVEGGAIWADTLAGRARRLDRPAQWQESLALYDRAISFVPWYAPYYQFRAEALFNLSRGLPETKAPLKAQLFAAADRTLARARDLHPLDLEHYANAGILHAAWAEIDPGHLEEAVAYYEQAFRLAPTRVSLRVELGRIYHHHARYRDALTQYDAALAIDPRSVEACYSAGLAWEALGESGRARAAFERALELDPACEACKVALASLLE
ncbi:MAG: tetratricopeptide repeat protein [Anaerolineae bacterium]